MRNWLSSDTGKNSVPILGANAKRSGEKEQDTDDEAPAMGQDPAERFLIAFVQRLVPFAAPIHQAHEPGRHRTVRLLFRLEELVAERRGHRAGDEKGGEQRDRDRDGQGNQQQAGNPGDEEDREEHDHCGDRRGENGHRHLAGRFQDRFPAAGRGVEMALNVLEFHDGIVDEPADPEGQASQGEHVQGLSGEVQHDEGHHDRKGNGDGNDQPCS